MKKLNKFFAILVSLAMMATLCVSMAFATTDSEAAGALAKDASDAKLVKYLQAGKGVTKPDASYNFSVTSTTANAAAATNTTIAKDAMNKDVNGDYIGTLTIAKMFENATWTQPGEYVYTVQETSATRVTDNTTWVDGANETLTLDTATTYKLRVYVKNSNVSLVIDKVTVSDGTHKVDPTIVAETADAGKTEQGGNVGMSVTNTYKNNLKDTDNTDNQGLINLQKLVSGNYASKTYKFDFDLDYVLPENNNGADAVVKYKVLVGGVGEATAGEQTATGGNISVQLANTDKLIITQAPEGIKWSTKENLTAATDLQNYQKYVPSVDQYGKYAEGKTAFDAGSDAETTQQILGDTTSDGTHAAPDGVVYTNTLNDSDVTPTGILMNNLPYIALALVAIGGLVAYVVVRRRQDDEA